MSHYWTVYGNIFLYNIILIPTKTENAFVQGCLFSFFFDDGNVLYRQDNRK